MLNLFKKENKYISQRTFTYFIPAPPSRKSGYQEKEFDFLMDYLQKNDLDILNINTQSIASEKSNGLWIICLLGAKTKAAAELKFDFEYQELAGQRHEVSEFEIELDTSIEHE